ncbi:MAG: hypothetical protein K0S76_1372 [Herbinix sp.]|jgi:zinc transport system substrate-binding protein|nr:hypothetical protein [Herbinix sp.]
MRNKILILLIAMVLVTVAGIIITTVVTSDNQKEVSQNDDKIKVLTTFYPVYMIGLNLAGQMDEIEIKSLTDLNTGCLHDYQLTTEDMKSIAAADILVINGGGMEGFLEEVIDDYPALTIVDASKEITMLPENVLEVGDVETSESGLNAHVWLDPKLYIKQIQNVRDGLKDYVISQNDDRKQLTEDIDINADTYINRVNALDSELDALSYSSGETSAASDQQAIIFHNSFAYLAARIGLKVAYAVPLDEDTALSAGDVAEIIDSVIREDIPYLFTEQQYSDSIAKRIEAETQAKVYIVDTAVTGDGSKDSYLDAMEENIRMLEEAFKR